jgi:hypothetical protein
MSKNILVINTEEMIDVIVPIIIIVAKFFIGPEPNCHKIVPTINVVIFASNIDLNAIL